MGRIPQETIDQVLAATDIVDVIDRYFPLKRAGSVYRALCPFHTEKTPSFTVNPSRGTFHCFGCGKGGSVIRFVMDYENIPFPDAVRKLAEKAGIPIAEEEFDPEEEMRAKQKRSLLALHRAAAEWYHRLLLRSDIAQPARDYLKRRGISSDTARNWQLGFAPASAEALIKWAAGEGYRERDLMAAGLLSLRDEENPQRGTYARFRDRLMFPVANDYGDTIAFSGRVLDPDAKTAKYMNSPETPIFSKSKILFGFDRSKRAVLKAGSAVICEGQLDLISAFEAGIENVAAPLGTAFTEQHARLLARHAPEVVLCFDADTAGFNAAQRAFAELAKANLQVRLAEMPPGEDPDSLIRSQGADAFRQLVSAARDFFDFQIDRGAATLDLTSMRDRVTFARTIAANIARLSDPIATDTAVHKVAARLAIPAADLRQLVADARRREKRLASRPRRAADTDDSPPPEEPVIISDPIVRMLIRLALTDARSLEWLRDPSRLAALRDVPGSELLAEILASSIDPDEPAALSRLLATLGSAKERCLARLLDERSPATGLADAQIGFRELEKRRLQREIDAANASLRAPTVTADEAAAALRRIVELKAALAAANAEASRSPASREV